MSTSITKTQRYLPHTLETRFHAVKTYRLGYSVSFVIRRYKISKASLMRWNRRFDGSRESLMDRSHRPKSPHPTAHTEEEKTWILNLIRRNPTISLIEFYAKLKFQKGYRPIPAHFSVSCGNRALTREKPQRRNPIFRSPTILRKPLE